MSTEKTGETPQSEGASQLTDSQKLKIRELQLKKLESLMQAKELEAVVASLRAESDRIAKEIDDYLFSIFGSDRVIIDSNLTATWAK